MQTAGAGRLAEDGRRDDAPPAGALLAEPDDREAVLLQWERKIEQAERRTAPVSKPGAADPAGRPRRRASLAERHLGAHPDRIALWAFLLGLFLVAVAAGTAHG